MKKFILNKVIGDNFNNQSVIEMIEKNVYKLEEFAPSENRRYGFTTVHHKVDNLHINGNGYVCATFKIANKSINKKVMQDLVKSRVSAAKAANRDFIVKEIEDAVSDKLKATADMKIKSVDFIFDTKNNLIYCSGVAKDFDDMNTLVMRNAIEGCTTRPFKAVYNSDTLGEFFTTPSKLPENFKTGHYAVIEIDSEVYSFKNVNLRENQEFEQLTSQHFTVTGMSFNLIEKALSCSFKVNKNGLPTTISASAIEGDASMEAEAGIDSSSEGKDMSAEEKLYDLLYTNSIVLVDALHKIAAFVYDLKQHDKKTNDEKTN